MMKRLPVLLISMTAGFLLTAVSLFAGNLLTIEKIDVSQLHKTYEESPHRYLLTAKVKGGSEPFKYSWRLDCGRLVTNSDSISVEWHYDAPGECENASVVFTALDSAGLGQVLTRKVFDPKTHSISDIKAVASESPKQTSSVAELSKESIDASNQQFNSLALYILIAIILAFLLFGAVRTVVSKDQKPACKIGDKKDCEFVRMVITVGEKEPGWNEQIEASLNALDYYAHLIRYVPTRGTTVSTKLIHEFVESLTRMHRKVRKLRLLGDGVNVHGLTQWQECEEQGFWFWKKNVWVTKEKHVLRITAPVEYRYMGVSRPHSWKPDVMLSPSFYQNKSRLKKIVDLVKKHSLDECRKYKYTKYTPGVE